MSETTPLEQMARAISGVDDPRYVWADDCVGQYWCDRVRAALSAAEQQGFVLVPKEPTAKMCQWHDRYHGAHYGPRMLYVEPEEHALIWKAMVDAALSKATVKPGGAPQADASVPPQTKGSDA